PVRTTVRCTPGSVLVLGPTTCTAAVTDTSTGGTTPTGTFSFASSGQGSFSANRCTLVGGSCKVSYTPAAAGSQSIVAAYNGDTSHAIDTASTSLTVTTPPPP